MIVSSFPDENVLDNYRGSAAAAAEMADHISLLKPPRIDDEFHSGRSVQTWQCFPEGGSLSSIESLPPIEDDESGTNGFPGTGDYSAHCNRLGDESSTLRVKLMCSYGGRILPRPSDGKLRYVGGETRIVSVRRDISYLELILKMKEHYGQDLSLKYQLPSEELDALISVSTDEDLQNMMEEYDRLEGGDGLQRLRVFLFSVMDGDVSVEGMDPKKSEQWYVEAVNGLTDSGSRKSEGGFSGGGVSSRPSAENLVALDSLEPHFDEQSAAALLLSKKMQDMHGGGFTSAGSSPALQQQQGHSRHLGGNSYALLEGGQQHFGMFSSDFGGHSDLDHYYPNPRNEALPPSHDHDRIMRGYGATETKMPRVGSHGKLSRLQEQHDDGQPDLISHELLLEPRQRFVLQQPQGHSLPVRQHPLEGNQEFRRGDYPSHLIQQHQQHQPASAHPMVYHKDQIYRAEQYPQHHRHPMSEEAYQAHDFVQQHHLPHQEDYFPGHMYQRTSLHAADGVGPHSAQYQVGSSPSSPRLPFRDGRSHPALHQQLSMHRAYAGNPVDHQYVRRPHEEPSRTYRLSSSPPRYRDHLLDVHPAQHHHVSHERFTTDQMGGHAMFDQQRPPEIISSRPGMCLYGQGYQDSSLYYQDNLQRGGGEGRRQVQQSSPHLNSRLDYQDQLMQMEHLSLHSRYHDQHDQPDVIDWQEKLLEVEEPRHVRSRPQDQSIESEMQLFLDQPPSLPFVTHGNNLEHSSQRFQDAKSSMGVVSDKKWSNGDLLRDGLTFPDEYLDAGKMNSSSNLASRAQTQDGSLDLPIFDKSGVFEMPPSKWTASKTGDYGSEAFPSIQSGVIDLISPEPSSFNEVLNTRGGNVSHMLSETGHLAEDMASSVLTSSFLDQDCGRRVSASHRKEAEVRLPVTLTGSNTNTQEVDLAPQPMFTVHSWDKVLVDEPHHESGTLKDEALRNSADLQDKVPDKPPADIALIAELEATSRGLQTIRNSDLEEIRELGSGTYGTVYHGKWRGTDVAIKRIKASCFVGKPSERERLVADFWKEACTLSQLHHPNVVAFYGVVPDGPGGTLATVTEYMVNGSLKQVLQKKDRTIDRRKRLLIATDAAFGMEYLHGKNIVHFDLKCENLLVNMRDPHRPVCKVGDLGLSKVKRQTMVSGGVRGTLPWMAPELLSTTGCMVTDRVDVFSFGIVMWELLTGEEPYANMHYGAIIGGIVNNTLRPPIPNWCDPAWRSLMERCWAADASTRPSFSEIASELRAMSSSLQPKA